MKTIAICCVNYHSYEALETYLRSLEQAAVCAAGLVEVSVFVADNTEHHVQPIHTACCPSVKVSVFPLGKNWGYFGAVRQLMLMHDFSTYDYTIISNVDLELASDFFVNLAQLAVEPMVGWVAPSVYSLVESRDKNPRMMQRYTLRRMRIFRWAYRMPLIHYLYTKTFYHRKRATITTPCTIYAGHGSLIILTREFVSRHGAIDYPVFLYGEEIYLAEECRRLGLSVVYAPEVRAIDSEHVSTGGMRRAFYYRCNYEAMDYLIRKFY